MDCETDAQCQVVKFLPSATQSHIGICNNLIFRCIFNSVFSFYFCSFFGFYICIFFVYVTIWALLPEIKPMMMMMTMMISRPFIAEILQSIS